MKTTVSKECDNYMKQTFKFYIILHFYLFCLSDKTIKKNSEIMLNKSNKCLFRYLSTFTFTVNVLNLHDIATTLRLWKTAKMLICQYNNYMKQMFNFSINVHFSILSEYDEKNQKNSEILLDKNSQFLFSYLYTLAFTVESFKLYIMAPTPPP